MATGMKIQITANDQEYIADVVELLEIATQHGDRDIQCAFCTSDDKLNAYLMRVIEDESFIAQIEGQKFIVAFTGGMKLESGFLWNASLRPVIEDIWDMPRYNATFSRRHAQLVDVNGKPIYMVFWSNNATGEVKRLIPRDDSIDTGEFIAQHEHLPLIKKGEDGEPVIICDSHPAPLRFIREDAG